MLLDDIAIANEVDPTLFNPIKRLQQWLFDMEFEQISYRQQGLGTALLGSVIGHAQTLGAFSLQGEVFQADLENTPGLLNWYERKGFVPSSPRPEQIDVLANITLELRARGQWEGASLADAVS